MSVSCECCVLSGRGLCFGLITSPEGSYLVWGVSAYSRKASIMRRPCPTTKGCCAMEINVLNKPVDIEIQLEESTFD